MVMFTERYSAGCTRLHRYASLKVDSEEPVPKTLCLRGTVILTLLIRNRKNPDIAVRGALIDDKVFTEVMHASSLLIGVSTAVLFYEFIRFKLFFAC